MLELEDEYLRRHPQRTWQGSGRTGSDDNTDQRRDAKVRDLIHTLSSEVLALLDNAAQTPIASGVRDSKPAQAALLRAFAAAPDGRLHKLEAHHVARSLAPNAALVASLYKQNPPLLRAEGDYRLITDTGRAWLSNERNG
jgi:hypothetical protein